MMKDDFLFLYNNYHAWLILPQYERMNFVAASGIYFIIIYTK